MAAKNTLFQVLITLALGAVCIFWLPWFIPLSLPSASFSYTYGFNNSVAIVSTALLLLVLFLIGWQRQKSGVTGNSRERLSDLLSGNSECDGMRGNLFTSFVIATSVAVALQVIWFRILPYSGFGEYCYFISRLDLMVIGLKPYADFQFSYGPAMLYPAYWLYKLFNGHLTIDSAYCATLVGHWIGGFYLLYYVIKSLGGKFNKVLVFICICCSVINLAMGLNYTPFRFAGLLFSLFYFHQTFAGRRNDGRVIDIKPAFLAFLLPLCNLAVSPEVGIASVVGLTVYLAALVRTQFRRGAWLAIIPSLALIVAVSICSKSYLEAVFSRGLGGDLYPVFPTFHILLFIGAACWVLPNLGIIGCAERNITGSFALALVCSLGLMIPACLGHCDSGHILFNGLGIFVLFLSMATAPGGKGISRLLLPIYILINIMLVWAMFWNIYGPQMKEAIMKRRQASSLSPPGGDSVRNEEAWQNGAMSSNHLFYGKLQPFHPDLKHLLRYKEIGMPFAGNESIERFVKLSGRYIPEYYVNPAPQMFTQSAINRKLDDLNRMEVVIVPKNYLKTTDQTRDSEICLEDSRFLQRMLCFPCSLTQRNRRLIPKDQIMERITANFSIAENFHGNTIWIRKSQGEGTAGAN